MPDTQSKKIRWAVGRAWSGIMPANVHAAFVYRGRIWSLEKVARFFGRDHWYELELEKSGNHPGSGGFFMAGDQEPPRVRPYLRWEKVVPPGVQDVKRLADLILTHEIMNS